LRAIVHDLTIRPQFAVESLRRSNQHGLGQIWLGHLLALSSKNRPTTKSATSIYGWGILASGDAVLSYFWLWLNWWVAPQLYRGHKQNKYIPLIRESVKRKF